MFVRYSHPDWGVLILVASAPSVACLPSLRHGKSMAQKGQASDTAPWTSVLRETPLKEFADIVSGLHAGSLNSSWNTKCYAADVRMQAASFRCIRSWLQTVALSWSLCLRCLFFTEFLVCLFWPQVTSSVSVANACANVAVRSLRHVHSGVCPGAEKPQTAERRCCKDTVMLHEILGVWRKKNIEILLLSTAHDFQVQAVHGWKLTANADISVWPAS